MTLDWPAVRERVDGAAVIAAHLGPPPRRKGDKSYWCCPFHDDTNPSMEYDPRRGRWKCWACGKAGDAADFLIERLGITFPEAAAILAGEAPGPERRAIPRAVEAMRRPRQEPAAGPEVPPKRLDRAAALALAEEARDRLWRPEGAKALAYLRGRGLSDATIADAQLGHVVRPRGIPWRPEGISIPWFEWGRLVYLNVRAGPRWLDRVARERRGGSVPPKYLCGFKDGPVLYPGLAAVRPFVPLVAVEGEFDALLLGQELAGLAAVVTCGAASELPGPHVMDLLRVASRIYVATDSDAAGKEAAAVWRKGSVRVSPPDGAKDWTESFQRGVDLKAFWRPHLWEA